MQWISRHGPVVLGISARAFGSGKVVRVHAGNIFQYARPCCDAGCTTCAEGVTAVCTGKEHWHAPSTPDQ